MWWYTEKKLGSVLPETATSSSSISSGSTSVDAAAATETPLKSSLLRKRSTPRRFNENKAEMKEATTEKPADKPADKPAEPSSEAAKPSAEADKPAPSTEKQTDTPKTERLAINRRLQINRLQINRLKKLPNQLSRLRRPISLRTEPEKPASTDAPKESASASETSEKK